MQWKALLCVLPRHTKRGEAHLHSPAIFCMSSPALSATSWTAAQPKYLLETVPTSTWEIKTSWESTVDQQFLFSSQKWAHFSPKHSSFNTYRAEICLFSLFITWQWCWVLILALCWLKLLYLKATQLSCMSQWNSQNFLPVFCNHILLFFYLKQKEVNICSSQLTQQGLHRIWITSPFNLQNTFSCQILWKNKH